MPLLDAKTLDDNPDGAALLASVLFATPAAKADALARGRERLARAMSLGEIMAPASVTVVGRSAGLPAAHLA